jgi:hypothetical protein
MMDPSITLEDYAQGNGIENSKYVSLSIEHLTILILC